MKKTASKIIAAVLLLVGFGIMLYPQISDYINQANSSKVIQSLDGQIKNMEKAELDKQTALAKDYNESLRSHTTCPVSYEDILNFGDGLMGHIRIPCIGVELPVYHGVSAQTLAKGVGHMPDTAFPVGGEGNHSVLTGHTGLPSAQLLTDLVKMEIGDLFYITVANAVLTYQVDRIKTVSPLDGSDLVPVSGEDRCTLLTCTPYGINSHRLLVQGRRVQSGTEKPAEEVTAEAERIMPTMVNPLIAVPLLAVIPVLQRSFRRKQ